ncbi:MAG: hypothetical protein ABIP48_17660 [Planctomycetota bacterium]
MSVDKEQVKLMFRDYDLEDLDAIGIAVEELKEEKFTSFQPEPLFFYEPGEPQPSS